MSIRPEWLWKIMEGEKTIEVRKTRPKIETPFPVFLYCSKGGDELKVSNWDGAVPIEKEPKLTRINGTVCAEFVCDWIEVIDKDSVGWVFRHRWSFSDGRLIEKTPRIQRFEDYPEKAREMCLTEQELSDYLGIRPGYAWHITGLIVYKKPRMLTDFRFRGRTDRVTRPPQSWCYVEEIDEEEATDGRQDKD